MLFCGPTEDLGQLCDVVTGARASWRILLRELAVSVLVGERDALTGVDSVNNVAASFPGADAVVPPRAGHFPGSTSLTPSAVPSRSSCDASPHSKLARGVRTATCTCPGFLNQHVLAQTRTQEGCGRVLLGLAPDMGLV